MHEGADRRAEIIEVQRLLKVRGEAAEPHPGKLVGGARDGDHGDAATLVVRLLTQPGDERCARLPDKRGVGDDQIDLDRPHIRTRGESVAGHQHAGAAHRQHVGKRLEAVGLVLDDEDDGAKAPRPRKKFVRLRSA